MKSTRGNFFEDFALDRRIHHAPSRTLTAGDAAAYKAIFGARFALQSSDVFARALGFPHAPLDDLLVFHTVFGMSVAEISLNAVANLGYADLRFGKPVYPGVTLRAQSKVIGLKQNSDGRTGIVYVRTEGFDEVDDRVLSFARWVMVRKRDAASPAPAAAVPELPAFVDASRLVAPPDTVFRQTRAMESGAAYLWDDYETAEKIDHVDGTTIEEAEHAMATRLYHNNARVHFNQFAEKDGRFGRRLVYGGHVISIARALSFNGLEDAFMIPAINGGRHVNPVFAGDTIFAWTEVLDKAEIEGESALLVRRDVGALRLRTIATKNLPCTEFPREGENVVLDLDYWAFVPRR